MKLERRKIANSIEEEAKKEPVKIIEDLKRVISTGSTLLNLAISGKRRYGGGIPAGILVEIFGPSATGKTAILASICANVQACGGNVRYLDPEGRLDMDYSEIYGLTLHKEDYHRPNTVTEMMGHIQEWNPETNFVNIIAADGIASLSTEMEMEKGDLRGQRRAKEFHEGLRKTCRLLANDNRLVVFTNQVREDTSEDFNRYRKGETTPGGVAIPFLSSLRIRVAHEAKSKLKRILKVDGVDIERIEGISSFAYIAKSTVDEPYRIASPLIIIFGYGIDDIRANLLWLKQMTKSANYPVGQGFRSIYDAIKYVEDTNTEFELKEKVIELWNKIEAAFQVQRKPKIM